MAAAGAAGTVTAGGSATFGAAWALTSAGGDESAPPVPIARKKPAPMAATPMTIAPIKIGDLFWLLAMAVQHPNTQPTAARQAPQALVLASAQWLARTPTLNPT